ncbi:MAG TPA: hypothetical protein VIM01_10860 [Dermatophilaceae bacterium]|jgi:hypothetical protein
MVTVTGNIALDDAATGTQTGTVGEPSVAASSTTVFVTGNWYASRSADRGATWTPLDPFTEFPTQRGIFCCDQQVLYLSGPRLWVWLLQYSRSGSSNIYRLAVSRTAASGTWHWWDVAPADLDPAWTDVWFDFPDLAASATNLWISFNQYDAGNAWKRAGVIRYPIDQLASATPITRRHWVTTAIGSLRLVNGAGTSMWFCGTDQARRSLRLFEWPDDATGVTAWTIPVSPWAQDGYISLGPGGAPWLGRCDDRVTGAWRAGGRLGFLWTSGRIPGRPQPFIRAVTLDEQTLAVVAEPDLWSQNGAWAYPAAAPSKKGRLGLSAFYGGPTHPAHAVGVLDAQANTWTTKITATSTHGPVAGKWGDYVVCRAHPIRTTSWVASGFTLQGGTDRRNIEPRVVIFRP